MFDASLLMEPERHSDIAPSASSAAFSELCREVAHDLNNVWSRIFGLTQQIHDMPGFQERDEVLSRVDTSSLNGLFYSRNVMEILRGHGAPAVDLDVGDWVRTWVHRTSELLGANIELSSLIPTQPRLVRLDRPTLHLILLSMVGYALRSDSKRWAMVGLRDVADDKRAEANNQVDLIFLCQQPDGLAYPPGLQNRIDAARAMVAPYAGVVSTSVVSAVGIEVRMRFPLASPQNFNIRNS